MILILMKCFVFLFLYIWMLQIPILGFTWVLCSVMVRMAWEAWDEFWDKFDIIYGQVNE